MNIKEVHNLIGEIATDFKIAGGACVSEVLGQKPNDFDVFTTENVKILEALKFKSVIVKKRNNSTVIQLECGTALDIVQCETVEGVSQVMNTIQNFDFLHCCLYYDGEKVVEAVESALDTCKSMKLSVNCITYPYHSLARASKFKSRGWEIGEDLEMQLLDYCYKAPWGFSNGEYFNL